MSHIDGHTIRINPDYWEKDIGDVESYEEQDFDRTKWHFASTSLVSDMFHAHSEWHRAALNHGFVPYWGEDNYVHWKLKRKNGMVKD